MSSLCCSYTSSRCLASIYISPVPSIQNTIGIYYLVLPSRQGINLNLAHTYMRVDGHVRESQTAFARRLEETSISTLVTRLREAWQWDVKPEKKFLIPFISSFSVFEIIYLMRMIANCRVFELGFDYCPIIHLRLDSAASARDVSPVAFYFLAWES